MGFPLRYSNSHTIPKDAQQTKNVNANSRQSSNRKIVPQNTGYQSFKNKNSKNAIHNILESRQKYFYSHPSKCCVTFGGIAQRCTNLSTEASGEYKNPWEFLPWE